MKRMRFLSRLTSPVLPLTTIAFVAVASAGAVVKQGRPDSSEGPRQTRVLASGRLTGGPELHRVVAWRTRGLAHLAIETAGSRPRVLWQMDSADPQSRVDSVRISDLDSDGVPEIISLWWKGSSSGASLRVVHWERSRRSFVEIHCEDELNNVRSYRVQTDRGNKSISRLVVVADVTSERMVPHAIYELRGSKLVSAEGGRIVASQGESGIEGKAIISPSHPGPVRQGESGSAPYKTTLVVWRTSDDQEVARVETGSDGRFRVVLPPGDYRIGPAPRQGRFLPRGSEETVTVSRGKFVSVTINFDSGMR